MDRKEAIEVIKKNWPDSGFTQLREALNTLVPELKESEDERIRKAIGAAICGTMAVSILEANGANLPDALAYLERQKEQKPAEWSEEDKKWFKEIELMALSFSNDTNYRERFFNWLKSIRPQSHWKPSEEQVDALRVYLYNPQYIDSSEDIRLKLVESLYNGLKSL